jgi:energy-coupling factor transporter transmembrane protein EcfT
MVTTNPFYLIVIAAAAWLVYAAHRRPGPQLRSFRIFVWFGVIAMAARTALVLLNPVLHIAITTSSVVVALLEGARIAVLLCVFGTFNSISDPYGLLRLSPRRLYEPVLAAGLALSLAPRTIATVTEVREAQRVRGANAGRWRALPALVVPVLETGMEEAVALAESMDARGHGRGRRTNYRVSSWNLGSWAIALGSLLTLGGLAWSAATGRGDLSVAMSPLQWPGVSLVLVVASAAIAIPAFFPQPEEGR